MRALWQMKMLQNYMTTKQTRQSMIGSPEKSMTKQKLEEPNAIFYFFIQHDIKTNSHSLKDIHV